MKISAVVFDFDGTLVDSNGLKRQGYFDVVAEHEDGSARMHQVLESVLGDRRAILSAYAESCARACVPCTGVDNLVQRYSDLVDASVARAPEIAGATALIGRLRGAGCHVYLSSATPLINLEAILIRRGWDTWFTGVYGYPSQKPHTLSRIQADLGLATQHMAVVGDGNDDRESAQQLGCAFFPVGEARGVLAHERVYALAELADALLRPVAPPH
jgi:phosphoglycolate phosphatase